MKILYASDMAALEERFFALIRHRIEQRRSTIALVPAQASFLVEQQIMRRCRVRGLLDIEVMSFEKLTERILAAAGGRAVPVLDRGGMGMLAKDALLRCEGDLRVLDARRDRELHTRVAELVASLKMENVGPQRLRELAEGKSGALADKLVDIALLYETMQELAGGALRDAQDMEADAAARIGACGFLAGKSVLVHGFDLLPERRMQTLAALARQAGEMIFTIEAEDEGDLFAAQRANIGRLRGVMERAGVPVETERLSPSAREPEIAHLMDNLYACPYRRYAGEPQRIHLAVAATRAEEVEAVAARILQAACEGGLAMREIGVMTADPAGYAPLIRDVFSRCGIPFFTEEKRPLIESTLGVFLCSALDILQDGRWRVRDVKRHIRSGFLPVERAEAERLCAYIDEHGLRGWMLKKPLSAAPEEMEELRARALGPVIALQERCRQEGMSGRALCGYMQELEVERRLEEEADQLEQEGLPAQARFLRQLYEKAVRLLAQTDLFAAHGDVRALRDVVTAGLEATAVAVVPPRADEVVVSDITHSIFPVKRQIYVLGANEGILPPLPGEGGLLSGYETQLLRQEQPGFPDRPTFDEQKPHIRRGLYSARELFISYSEDSGRPSLLVDRIRRLFPDIALRRMEGEPPRSAAGGMEALARELRARLDGEAPQESLIPAYLAEAPERLAALLGELDFANEPVPLAEQTARAVYGRRLAGSVSAVEQYYRCPYQHFVRHALRPQETREYREDEREAGNYLHALMDGFTRGLRRSRIDWKDAQDEQIEDLMEHAARACREEHNRGIFTDKRHAFTEKRLREEAVLAAKMVRRHIAGTQVKVSLSEQGFGFADGLVLHAPGGDITLKGRIDRVDELERDGVTYLRVVDYKSGKKSFLLHELYEGVSLQLVVYLIAVLAWYRAQGKKALPAGAFYFRLQLPVLRDGDEKKLENEFRMKGLLVKDAALAEKMDARGSDYLISMNVRIKKDGEFAGDGEVLSADAVEKLMDYVKGLIARAVEEIFAGKLAMTPLSTGSVCENCDYHAICRFDEEFAGNRKRLAERSLTHGELLRRMGISDDE